MLDLLLLSLVGLQIWYIGVMVKPFLYWNTHDNRCYSLQSSLAQNVYSRAELDDMPVSIIIHDINQQQY